MGERARRVVGVALALVVLSTLLSLASSLGRLWGDDPPPMAAGAVTDPLDDAAPGNAGANAGRPPGIDLVSANVIRDDGALTFTATTADDGGERPRTWVLRLRKPNGPLLYMLYAQDMPIGGEDVFLCPHDEHCTDRAEGAFTESAPPRSIRIRVPLERLSKLPEIFEWEASVSGALTANIDDTWNDFTSRSIVHLVPND